ncbi:uncharacterized protein FIBRA_09018 [Fibroporia radiculosa]|uniref:Uncharacterized protein n=1 Tax=Fibroporia radiculosa TaxID=599839 RepID=J4H5H0_9APHY|nr:uncharacterized protein FIBRA_09018 [Fibroporia radiculosa]CCM06724.1 predicted protein [Fibroporia radiculosa]
MLALRSIAALTWYKKGIVLVDRLVREANHSLPKAAQQKNVEDIPVTDSTFDAWTGTPVPPDHELSGIQETVKLVTPQEYPEEPPIIPAWTGTSVIPNDIEFEATSESAKTEDIPALAHLHTPSSHPGRIHILFSQSNSPVSQPPTQANPEPGVFWVHMYGKAQTQIFMRTRDEWWLLMRQLSRHPYAREYVLLVLTPTDMRWVTREQVKAFYEHIRERRRVRKEKRLAETKVPFPTTEDDELPASSASLEVCHVSELGELDAPYAGQLAFARTTFAPTVKSVRIYNNCAIWWYGRARSQSIS